MELLDKLIGKFAPHVCVACGQEGALLCVRCCSLLPDSAPRDRLHGLDSVRAATIYDSFAKDLVAGLKFQGTREAAGIMARQMVPLVLKDKKAVIVPVPTSTKRVRQRGFDQADLIARELAKHTRLATGRYLKRHGHTHQIGASREQRLQQLKSSFSLRKGTNLDGRRVILVDDVTTTGATLEAAAAMVRAAGPAYIEAIVFAQAE